AREEPPSSDAITLLTMRCRLSPPFPRACLVVAAAIVSASCTVPPAGTGEAPAAVPQIFDRAEIAKGAELAAIGNCVTCHTARAGAQHPARQPHVGATLRGGVLEGTLFQACRLRAQCDAKCAMESRRLPYRGAGALQRLPYAPQCTRRGETRALHDGRRSRRLACAGAECLLALAGAVERGIPGALPAHRPRRFACHHRGADG